MGVGFYTTGSFDNVAIDLKNLIVRKCLPDVYSMCCELSGLCLLWYKGTSTMYACALVLSISHVDGTGYLFRGSLVSKAVK